MLLKTVLLLLFGLVKSNQSEQRSLHFINSESKSSTKGRGATLRQRGSVARCAGSPQTDPESERLRPSSGVSRRRCETKHVVGRERSDESCM